MSGGERPVLRARHGRVARRQGDGLESRQVRDPAGVVDVDAHLVAAARRPA